MTPEEELDLLVKAERAEAPSRVHMERGFERLQEALGANVPALDIGAVDPTQLGASTGVGKLVTLPWVAKFTAVVGVVATTGALVGQVHSNSEPASGAPASAAVPAAAAVPATAAVPAPTAVPAAASAPAALEADSAAPRVAGGVSTKSATESSARPALSPERPLAESVDAAEAPSDRATAVPEAHEPSVKAFDDAPAGQATPPQTGFDAELVLIKRAKAEFDRGRDDLARGWLREHAQRFPTGVFAAERDGLLVLSTCRANPTAGQAVAQAFLQRYPQSPLATRIRRSCGFQ